MKKIIPWKRLASPLVRFIHNSSFSGMLIFFAAFLAVLLANTPARQEIQAFLEIPIGFQLNSFELKKPIILWINDGLISVFFFVLGLELKREMVAGELSSPRNALLPIAAAIGGMLIPALIYVAFNLESSDDTIRGWGIPMYTDIAFSLGVLMLLGSRVPLTLKVFLTAIAIIDDLGAVIVIALFYSSDISLWNLMIGFFFWSLMIAGNRAGIRNVFFYGILGIGGVWLAFLLSGVHATIAGVLAAFTIPASRSVNSKRAFVMKLEMLADDFKDSIGSRFENHLVSPREENIIHELRKLSSFAIAPLQKLEHSLHPLVAYGIVPIFALANAGVQVKQDWASMLASPVALGVGLGLLVGKVVGIFGVSALGIRLGWFPMPNGLNYRMILGASLLAGIGFTMSLFVTSLAFKNPVYAEHAKIGILTASLIAGVSGYAFLRAILPESPIQ